jgi:hypothetical protein
MGDELHELKEMGVKFGAMRYIAAIDFYKHYDWQRKNLSLWYGYFGMGFINYAFSKASTKTTESDFTFAFGLGAIQMISRDIGIDICVNYDLLFASTEAGSTIFGLTKAAILDMKVCFVKYFIAAN